MSKEKTNVESFDLDHTKVQAPYVRLAGTKTGQHGDVVTKYDVRFKQPNKEHMAMPALHSLEHLTADRIRNHSDQIIDWSPMGCQTGFYVSLINHDDYDDVLNILEATMNDVLAAESVPACNEVQCGWAASHSLEGAKELAQQFLDKRDEWTQVFAAE
ncbi:S-ribosylhomocysteine lyase [Kurthia huakuii]|uniref:S-ribosylhomocysteine lyase n=1 Tax=Kurthia huakuii TaxID=1421019 RepID=UPI00049603E9|nr:S-ribosylhomocysteine lyase [Kurthia huakuii]MBM7698081.1 S-ribosylhomocysteine lyase [Kurthia huakuii]